VAERKIEGDESCRLEQRREFQCYCPMDFRGEMCEIWQTLSCDVDIVKEECPETHSFYFDSNYFGDLAPCHNLTESSDATFQIEMNCSNSKTDYYFEGFKNLDTNSYYTFNSKDHVVAMSQIADYYSQIGYNWRATKLKDVTASDYFLDSGGGLIEVIEEIPTGPANLSLYEPFNYFYQNQNVSISSQVSFWFKKTAMNWNNFSASTTEESEVPIQAVRCRLPLNLLC
jgi:hypothetical protein